MSEQTRFTATKFDDKKPPMDLIPWESMVGVSQVLDFGRQKYAPHNWRKGFLWTRLASAALRHIFSWLSGEDKDPESGLSHIDHATCCLMFLSAHIKSGLGKDDRAHVLLTDATIPAAHVPKHTNTQFIVTIYNINDGWVHRAGPYVTRSLAQKVADDLSKQYVNEEYQVMELPVTKDAK